MSISQEIISTIGSEKKSPHELISKNYYRGPSKMIPLGKIRSEDGFRFVGVDREGGEHHCVVHKGDSNSYYMSSKTIKFEELIGWIPPPWSAGIR